jgi:two-component system chemotaxis sensor kinase CheA
MTDELLVLFREGTRENLDELEAALLELRERPTDRAEVDRIFRVMHTIKGSAGMLGLEAIAQFAHALENEFDAIRTGRCLVTPALIELALQARDLLLVMIEEPFGGPPAPPTAGAAILEGFRCQRAAVGASPADWPGAPTTAAAPTAIAGAPAGGSPPAPAA